ncbi:MAG: hypothetical protein ACR2JY_05325 [Chloroflexota bacterium]
MAALTDVAAAVLVADVPVPPALVVAAPPAVETVLVVAAPPAVESALVVPAVVVVAAALVIGVVLALMAPLVLIVPTAAPPPQAASRLLPMAPAPTMRVARSTRRRERIPVSLGLDIVCLLVYIYRPHRHGRR